MGSDRKVLRDALAALSLGNISLLQIWVELLDYTPADSFFLQRPPLPIQYMAAICNVLLLGACFFALIRLTRMVNQRFGAVWATLMALAIAAIPLNALRATLANYFPLLRSNLTVRIGVPGTVALYAGLILGLAFMVLRLRARTFGIALTLLAEISPLCLLTGTFAVIKSLSRRPELFVDGATASRLAGLKSKGHRVIWIIFDEMDYRLAFVERPANLVLPEFDALRAQAVFATQAFSPSNDTLSSVPSLLAGRRLMGEPTGPARLLAHFRDAETMPMTPQMTIFADVRQLGGNAAVAGWYLPYCRLFPSVLAECSWVGQGSLLTITGDTLATNLVNQDRSLFETSAYSIFGQSLMVKNRIGKIQSLRRTGVRYAADPALDLVFLHYPIPHAPHTYDRRTQAFTKANSLFDAYPDSLALADAALGELRAAMTKAGLWDSSAILVSSDHYYRASVQFDGKQDRRVPWLLKLPGQTRTVGFDQALQTLLSRRLIEAILRGEIVTTEQALQWLAGRSSESGEAGN
ncbi:MAG TPA: sulfatase-like hydrolase/transferase [Bryobacteraceae bacterium]|nr:sulfatase-like hydrolase/transferase [Bryobacteraceae bacterium]